MGGSGALRPLKLAKHLPKFEWNPIILTVKKPDYYYATDSELLKELAKETAIIRSHMIRSLTVYRLLNPFGIRKIDKLIKRYIFHPDEQIGWIPFAIRAALKVAREQNIDVVYSTSGPLSCHLIANYVKKKTGLPWIAEFRDEWLEDPMLEFPNQFYRRFHLQLEKEIVANAEKIVVMAPGICGLLKKHSGLAEKCITIPGGFDLEDYNLDIGNKFKNNIFILTFTGLIYDTFRPNFLIKAVNELIRDKKIDPEKVKIQFVGANSEDDIDEKDKYGVCDFTGFVPRGKALDYMTNADALLLLLSRERGEHIIPSKTFDYIVSCKPILALVPPDGGTAEIIRQTKTGTISDFDDEESIKKAYLKLYRNWEENKEDFQPDLQQIQKYDQNRLFRKLADLLNEMI